jgi:hypothetical protein
MINRLYDKFISLGLILSIGFISLFSFDICNAQITSDTADDISNQAGAFQIFSGYELDTSVGSVMALVIKGFLSLLGIIFIVLIIVGGYNWMTAAGDEEKIKKAKDTLRRAIIGLIIVVSAYAITYFVFSNLEGVSGGATGPG